MEPNDYEQEQVIIKCFHECDFPDELVCILPHKWVEPVTIPLVY